MTSCKTWNPLLLLPLSLPLPQFQLRKQLQQVQMQIQEQVQVLEMKAIMAPLWRSNLFEIACIINHFWNMNMYVWYLFYWAFVGAIFLFPFRMNRGLLIAVSQSEAASHPALLMSSCTCFRTYTTSVCTIIHMHIFHRSTSTASLHSIKWISQTDLMQH